MTITSSWSGASCGYFQEEGDEFSGADPAAAFDAHAEMSGTGNCTVSVTTGHPDDAVWAACVVPNVVTAPGPGFTFGVSAGNPTEYKLTADAAGTVEAVSAVNSASTDMYEVVAVTLKPR